jgi:hypothetical protein
MTFITLNRPISSGTDLERLHLFAGRHLGQYEFLKRQHYAENRVMPLLSHRLPGIIHGLTVSQSTVDTSIEHFQVHSGLAVTAQGQTLTLRRSLHSDWDTLIEDFKEDNPATNLTGVYYLVLKQSTNTVNRSTVEPCERFELDPTRDTQRVNVVSIELKRIAINPDLVQTATAEDIQNRIAADRVQGTFLSNFDRSVPLAMLAITDDDANQTIKWVSEQAGRYLAQAHGGYHTLLQQTSAAIRHVSLLHQKPENSAIDFNDFLKANLKLNRLPAAGQLPINWLKNPEAPLPELCWFPEHLTIDMIPIPTDSVTDVIQRHYARLPLTLNQPSGDKLRLLIALGPKDYAPDVLDIPQTDSQLEQDLFRFFIRSHQSWLSWKKQFNRLYYMDPSSEALLETPADVVDLESSVLDPLQFRGLGLPVPATAPVLPIPVMQSLRARALVDLTGTTTGSAPYPYGEPLPIAPDFYTRWLVETDAGFIPPQPPEPEEDGYVVQYAIALVDLEAIENQIRSIRTRLEKSRDLVLLQRQQLDSQTVALASLAGGVSGDGNGLKVARWLPYATLNTVEIDNTPETTTAATISKTASPYLAKTTANTMTNYKMAAKPASFEHNLLSAALNTNIKTAPAYLTRKPETYSAFELSINKSRLDLLANLSKEAVAKPAYEAKEFRFGVIDHISPEVSEYEKAYFGMQDLLSTLTSIFDATDAYSLKTKLKKVMNNEAMISPDALEALIDSRTTAIIDEEPPRTNKTFNELRSLIASQERYRQLFNAGKVLTQWIAICESRYNQVERKLQGKLREHSKKLAHIEKLSGLIRIAREVLENLDASMDERAGDYGVAQKLLEEDWRKVYHQNNERKRILTQAIQGLYYVRVRNTPISKPLVDPLALRYSRPTDLVPGCAWQVSDEIPEQLNDFFEAVTEIPIKDWRALSPLHYLLPSSHRYPYLMSLRNSRYSIRTKNKPMTASSSLLSRLKPLQTQTQTIFHHWSGLSATSGSAKSTSLIQKQASAVFSIADLMIGTQGKLKREISTLHEKLESAMSCLLDLLSQLPGSIRLAWGQLAEDDRINVGEVGSWPRLKDIELDQFNTARTLSELVAWWFKQLDNDASAQSKAAMKNCIRAALIYASLGDPSEIVRGKVSIPPTQFRDGERFRVSLNRAVYPGVKLQLLDQKQQLTAELTVEDSDRDSVQVLITKRLKASINVNEQFTVLGRMTSVSL